MPWRWLTVLKVLSASALLSATFALPALADTTAIKVGVAQNMDAQLLTPDGAGPFPALLLLHTSGGLQAADLEYAKRLVDKGYVVLVPAFLDAYGIRARTRQLAFTGSAQPIYADLVASLEQLRGNAKVKADKLGAIGFSNGGYFALWLAATGRVRAGISYYGALTRAGTDRSLSRFQQAFSATSSPVLVLHGDSDSTVPVAKARELDAILRGAGTPHEVHTYADAEHRFDRDQGAANAAAAADAWQRSLSFLRRHLGDE